MKSFGWLTRTFSFPLRVAFDLQNVRFPSYNVRARAERSFAGCGCALYKPFQDEMYACACSPTLKEHTECTFPKLHACCVFRVTQTKLMPYGFIHVSHSFDKEKKTLHYVIDFSRVKKL